MMWGRLYFFDCTRWMQIPSFMAKSSMWAGLLHPSLSISMFPPPARVLHQKIQPSSSSMTNMVPRHATHRLPASSGLTNASCIISPSSAHLRELGTREKCACVHPTTTAELIIVVVVNIVFSINIAYLFYSEGVVRMQGGGRDPHIY